MTSYTSIQSCHYTQSRKKELVTKQQKSKVYVLVYKTRPLNSFRNLLGTHDGWTTKQRLQVINSEPSHAPGRLHT